MAGWRTLAATILILLIALPLAAPLALAARQPPVPDPGDLSRLAGLARNSALLVALVLLLALPLGTALAALLERTDLPARGPLTLALVAPLFVPLPLFVSAWSAAVGPAGAWPLTVWLTGATGWSPWAEGLGPAAFIHAAAGLPWVVFLAGLGARSVERALEDDARLLMPPGQVFLRVTLPRMAAAVAAAALVVALQAAGEVTITDLMQVRTFAEEVYTQLVGPEPALGRGDPLARALVGALAQMALAAVFVAALARRAERLVPAAVQPRPPAPFRLGRLRWAAFAGVALLTFTLLAVPTAGLVWRAGASGAPLHWSPDSLLRQLVQTARSDGGALLRQAATCAAAGALCAALALTLSWLVRGSRWLAALAVVLIALAWATPGPVLGLGLKAVLRAALDLTGWPRGLATALWYGPSPLPLVWVYLFRYLPVAMALVWPVVRLVPRELLEPARLDGAGPARELFWVVGPYARAAALRAAVAVTVLSLGELSAAKLVSTPGAESYAEVVWAQMHYGVSGDLAARCLLLLALTLAAAAPLLRANRA